MKESELISAPLLICINLYHCFSFYFQQLVELFSSFSYKYKFNSIGAPIISLNLLQFLFQVNLIT